MGMKTMVNVSMLDQGIPLYICLSHPQKSIPTPENFKKKLQHLAFSTASANV